MVESTKCAQSTPPGKRASQLLCPYPDCEGVVKDEMHRTGRWVSLRPLADGFISLVQCLRIFFIRKTFSTTSGSSLLSV